MSETAIATQPILDHVKFALSEGEITRVDASVRARKRVIAGAGTLKLDGEDLPTGASVVIDKQATVQGPGYVFVQDTASAPPPKKSIDKPKRKAKRTKES